MANTNAPYGFRLWARLTGGTGASPVVPGQAAGGTMASSGPLAIASATTLKVGDPIRSSLGLGYLALTTYAVYGICNSPVPGFGETATQKHYPEIIPADEQSIWRCQSISTVNATVGYIGTAKGYRIGGSTSGYLGIDLSSARTTASGGVLEVIGLAPGSAWGTYAEVLVMFRRGPFYGMV